MIVGLNLLFFLGFSALPTAVSWWQIAFLLLPNSGLSLLAVGLHIVYCGVFATNLDLWQYGCIRKVGASFNRNWRNWLAALRLAAVVTGRSKKTIILINLASLILVFFQWQDFRQFQLFGVFVGDAGLKWRNHFVDSGQGAEVLPFDADLTVKGLDKVLFDAGGQFRFQTALFMQMYND